MRYILQLGFFDMRNGMHPYSGTGLKASPCVKTGVAGFFNLVDTGLVCWLNHTIALITQQDSVFIALNITPKVYLLRQMNRPLVLNDSA